MSHCSRFNAILVNTKNPDLGLLVRARCKQWDCSYCARQNRLAWRATLYHYITDNPDLVWSFHTFTFDFGKRKEYARLIYSVNRIKSCWDTLMKRLKRRYGNFQYIRILEPHKKGGYHIHMMASFKIPDSDIAYRYDKIEKRKVPYLKWLHDDLVTIGFGYIQHSENAVGNGAQTVTYITKYMTKDNNEQYKQLKDNKIRYVQTSRGIKSPFNKSDNEIKSEWKMRKHLIFLDFLNTLEWRDLNEKKTVTIDDLEDNGGYYPKKDI